MRKIYDSSNPPTKAEIGLSNVDNTSDLNKPISTATQTALNNKVSKSGDTMTGNLTVPKVIPTLTNENGTSDISVRPYVERASANRLVFLPADQIIIEKTVDGGTTWTDYGATDAQKVAVFTNGGNIILPRLNGTTKSTLCGVRITFTAMKYNVPSGTSETEKYNYWNSNYILRQERYTTLDVLWFWLGANSDTIQIKAERATGGNSTNWISIFDKDWGATGWSGSDWIRFGSATFGGGTNQTGNFWNYRLTFMSRYNNGATAFASDNVQNVYEIQGFGENWWGASSELMKNGHLYSWDASKNATFPAQITATQFNGTATRATADASGNNIKTTYLNGGSISVTPSTTTVNSITAVGSLSSLTFAPNSTSKNMTIAWNAGTLPTKGANTTVATGISSATFTGTHPS